MKTFAIALVVDNLDTYLQMPQLAQLAENVIQVTTAAPAPNPGYAGFFQPKVVTTAKIPGSKPGQVVFLEHMGGEQYETISRLNYPTRAQIQQVWNLLLSGPLDGSGRALVEAGNSMPLGLGLIDLNIPDFLPRLPALVWLLLALGAGFGAYKSKKIYPRIAYGAAAWLAASKFIQSQQSKVQL